MDKDMNVLIVDDYQVMLRIINNLLKQIGLEKVDTAADGGEAFQKFKSKKYDLVISDWNMEPVSGIDFLKQVRAHDENSDVPFLLVTAESKTENVIVAKKAGVDNYIVKPFNADTLKTKIKAAIDSKQDAA